MSAAFRPLVLIAALAVCGQAVAEDDARRAALREDAGDRVRQVERDGGRVLQAQPMRRGDRETYRLKVLTPEGRVRVIDAPREPERDGGRARAQPGLPDEYPRSGSLLRERMRAREAMQRERDQVRALPRHGAEAATTGDGVRVPPPSRPEPRRRDD
ncbi:hypothetical protein [Arenimonas fontis]|uniref:PepSY domain-containing protein n=1 Tax=Arenimonas fontis TaxID=2608255 RepID=A0A5B2ZBY0_9GAMM|nr:hypothetical protein [Arenimonas fontis]KAA2285415.1 hypothetical protein F0415_05740 [Arenimonas fontis]